MQLTIDINNNAIDKVMYLLKSLKSDVTILDCQDSALDIEIIDEQDRDYQFVLKGRDEKSNTPHNFKDFDSINW